VAQNDQIQALIQEIDEVLSKTTPRLPWVMSTDAMRQRQVLEQARSCLDKLQIPSQGLTDQTIDPEAKLLPSGQPAAESAQQVLQAVLQEMTYLRVNMLQPMRSDVDLLRQQREALTQEIRQLEAQRQQYGLPQGNPQLLMEFLQSAMGQMQESLRGQVTQMVASLAVEGAVEPPLLHGAADSENLAIASLSSAQRLEQIQRVQIQSDQLLLKLDSTLQVIFDSLQNNILTYQESLEQGLSRMQSLGQQGEAMFSALVTRLAEQLGKEASVYLQSQSQQQAQQQVQSPAQPQILEGDRALSTKRALDENADAEIARLLEELNSLSPTNPQPDSLETRWQPQPFALEVGSLEALDQELQQLDLSVAPLEVDYFPDDDGDLTFFQEDQEFPFSKFSSEDATRIQNLDLDQAIQDLDQVSIRDSHDPSPSYDISHTFLPESFSQSDAPSDSSSEDLESALDLLNQLSAEAETELPEGSISKAESNELPIDSFKPDGTLELGSVEERFEEKSEAIAPPSLIDSPDNLYTDDFYQSLFGDTNKNLKISENSDVDRDLDSNLTNLPNPDLASETLEPTDFLSFEVDTENELAPSVDLNEWFQEDVPTPQGNTSQSNTLQPEDPLQSYSLTAAPSHEDLFGGAVDPAIAQPIQDAEADFLPDFSIAPFPQSVENFLLSEPASPQEPSSFDSSKISTPIEEDIFWELAEEIQIEPVAASPAVTAPVETISALTDLISEYATPNLDVPELERPEDSVWAIATPAESDVSDPDAFEPAHPGEDLLISATSQETIANFEVGEDTLQRLTADLSTLELPGASLNLESASLNLESDLAPQATNREDTLSVDPLADLYLKAPSEGTIDSQADQIANAITLEDLLFTDELEAFAPDPNSGANPDPDINFFEAPDQTSDQTSVQFPDQASDQPSDRASDSRSASSENLAASGNAFTLEGLDILFEGIPSLPGLEIPDTEAPELETQPKKKV
jgi:hypothetical protein